MRGVVQLIVSVAMLCGGTAIAEQETGRDVAPRGQAEQTSSPAVRPFSLTVAGGISLGNYEAGMNWALLESLKSSGKYELVAATGASAGAINALASALLWCSETSSKIDDNLFSDIWINIGLDTLLPRGRDMYAGDDLLFSRKTSFGLAMEHTKSFIRETQFRHGCRVELAITVTGDQSQQIARGKLTASSNYYVIPMTMVVNGGKPLFYSNYDYMDAVSKAGDRANNAIAVGPRGAPIDIDTVLSVVVGSAAYPLAFGPVKVRYYEIGGRKCEAAAECVVFLSDGGLFDNVPLGLARALVTAAGRIEPSSVDYVYFNPGVRRLSEGNCSRASANSETDRGQIARTIDIYAQALVSARSRVLFETLKTWPVGEQPRMPTRFAPLTADLASAFGAFFDPGFRWHDYFAGVYDGLAASPEKTLRLPPKHASLMHEFGALESSWSARAGRRLPANPQQAPVDLLDRVRVIRYALFGYHVGADGHPRDRGGGFCNEQGTVAGTVKELLKLDYKFHAVTSEFLHSAAESPDLWMWGLGARLVWRMSEMAESHPLVDIAGAMDSFLYPFDPRKGHEYLLDTQTHLRRDKAELFALGSVQWISETGRWRAGGGVNTSYVASDDWDMRAGIHGDLVYSFDPRIALWGQLPVQYGFRAKAVRAHVIAGVQFVEFLRLGVGYSQWIVGKDDPAWKARWSDGEGRVSLLLGFKLDPIIRAVTH